MRGAAIIRIKQVICIFGDAFIEASQHRDHSAAFQHYATNSGTYNKSFIEAVVNRVRVLSLIFYAEFYWKLVLQFSCTLRCTNDLIAHNLVSNRNRFGLQMVGRMFYHPAAIFLFQ